MKKSNLVIILVLITLFSFRMEVNAAEELSCLYENSGVADKVMLVQEKDGDLIVYKNNKNAGWEDLEWYVAKAIPRWGDTKKKNGKVRIDTSNTDDDKKISNLTSCPTAKITLKDGALRFYKEDVTDEGEIVNFKAVCYLDDSRGYAFTPSIYEYETTDKNFKGQKCSSLTVKQKWNSVKEEHNTMCLYSKDVSEGCHVILLGVDEDKSLHVRQSEPLSGQLSEGAFIKSDTDSVNVEEIFGSFTGNCPDSIFVFRKPDAYQGMVTNTKVNTVVYLDNSPVIGVKKVAYYRDDQLGENLVTGGALENKVELNFEKINILNCDDLLGSEDLKSLLKYLLTLFKILVPGLLIGLGTVDFAKAIFSGSEDSMKKAQNKFIKRVIIAVAIFLVPSVLKLILSIANGIWGNIDTTLCGLL